ncbi:Elongator complex protein 6 like protein [Habropoda laboriosa]|uniref:Elongator complex protein 6 n=2 Tax=Habropoda laboriosa TaxID=597456 RepID=A0A0L7RHW7_9HYME|nr:Elongator complex protein 6 like protein [Habropoda laboriosa]
MDPVSNTIGIDKVNMDGKLILIEEQHESNANFLLNSIICNALNKNYEICFVLCHNTFNHYHNMGKKFGYNLSSLKEKGKVTVIEPMKVIASDVNFMHTQTSNKILLDVLLNIKMEYESMTRNGAPVVLLVDDISNFYNLGFDLKEYLYFIRFCRSLIKDYSRSYLCVVMHTYKHTSQSCISTTFTQVLKHMAQLFIVTEPLETGHSSRASGKIAIHWRIDSVRIKYNWPEIARYIYKLSDHHVDIYAPGTMTH